MNNYEAIAKVLRESERPLRTREIYVRVQDVKEINYSSLKKKLMKLATKGYSPVERLGHRVDGGKAYFYTIKE